MPRVWLTQWLCPRRHCAFAVPWEEGATTHAEVVATGEELARGVGLNMHCGICLAPVVPESMPTAFKSLVEAMPALAALQHEQIVSREVMDSLGISAERGNLGGRERLN